jgi:hypothetical protein
MYSSAATPQHRSVVATAQQGVGHSDGKLTLDARTLTFQPFNQAFGLGPYHINRSDIVQTELCHGKGGGFIPLATKGIEVTTADNKTYQFLLAEPEQWLALLQQNN